MPDSVVKFIRIMEDKIEETDKMINLLLLQGKIESFQIEENTFSFNTLNKHKDNLTKVISFFKKEEKYGTLYKYYNYISKILQISKLTDYEKLEVLMYAVKINIDYLTEEVLDLNILKKLYAPQMDSKKFNQLLESLDINTLLQAKEETLSVKKRLIREKIIEALRAGEKSTRLFKKSHRNIENHYINKIDSYNEQDIQFVIVSLKAIGVDRELQEITASILRKNLRKIDALKSKKIKENRIKPFKKTIVTPKPLSKTEYDAIYSRIMKMYDIEEHTIVSALTKEEIVYLVSLMFRINIPEKEIRKSIQKINWQGWKAYDNPIKEFNDYYDKLQKNSHIGEVEIALQNIKEYLSLAFLPENDNEYVGWKLEIAEELKRVRKILNQDDTYELEEGRKLYRNRIKGEEADGSNKK